MTLGEFRELTRDYQNDLVIIYPMGEWSTCGVVGQVDIIKAYEMYQEIGEIEEWREDYWDSWGEKPDKVFDALLLTAFR